MYPRHLVIPQTPTGYALNTQRGALSVVVPEATTNLITNPSFETNTTSWAVRTAGSISRETGGAYGRYYLSCVPGVGTSGGARYTFGASVALSGTYTLSFEVAAETGATIIAAVQGTTVATVRGRGDGVWFRVECRPILVNSVGSAVIDITRTTTGSGATDELAIDGVQFEEKSHATTYADGDQIGFIRGQLAYYWAGTRHGSTSVRLATTNHGGRVMNLQSLGLTVLSILGLGLAPATVIAPRLPTGGGYYQRTTLQPRTLTVVGDISAASDQALDQQRTLLTRALSPARQSGDQPIKLIYENYNQAGTAPISSRVELLAAYQGGLEGSRTGLYQERVTPEFQVFMPFLTALTNTARDLLTQYLIPSASRVMFRDYQEAWAAPSGAASGAVLALLQASNGTVYVAGSFTDVGGIANTRGIARWDAVNNTWVALGTGAGSGSVLALAESPDGTIYAGGSFASMGGVANTNLIAAYNPATNTWSSISSSASAASEVRAIVVGPGGQIYAGGTFTTLGGTAANRIIRYNPAGPNWATLSTGLNNAVNALAITNNATDVTVYAAGTFTTAGGSGAAKIAAWNVLDSTWSAMGAGIDSVGDPYALLAAQDGLLYVGGAFSSAGGNSAASLATWNGTVFTQVGGGMGGGAQVLSLEEDNQGNIYVGGLGFAIATDVPDSLAVWNGSTFIPPDVDLPGSATVTAILVTAAAAVWLGFNTTGPAATAYPITLTYEGTAPAYPAIYVTGPVSGAADQLYSIVNHTTGAGLWFDLAVAVGETITITLDPQSPDYGVSSSLRGNLLDAVLPGSDLVGWQLWPGDNVVAAFTEDSNMEALLVWRNRYGAIEDTVLR